MAFAIKQHDRRPYLTGTIKQPNGSPMNLSGVTAAYLIIRKTGSNSVLLRKPVIFTDPANGRFQYVWETGDTDSPGTYDAEIELQWGAEPQTVPVDSYYRIIVVDDLDQP